MKTKLRDYNSIDWHSIFIENRDSPTGLAWKVQRLSGKLYKTIKADIGDVAGSIWTDKSGHTCARVSLNSKIWFVHRILYVMYYGYIDNSMLVDHIDGNSLNNSKENLRLVSDAFNARNAKQRKDNTSGKTGVYFRTSRGKTYVIANWMCSNGKEKSKCFSPSKLGLLESFAAACTYREKMIAELNSSGAGYSDRHGT